MSKALIAAREKLTSAGGTARKLAKAPKLMKPGSAKSTVPKGNVRLKKLTDRAKASGRIDDQKAAVSELLRQSGV